jgi:hypothetical protein
MLLLLLKCIIINVFSVIQQQAIVINQKANNLRTMHSNGMVMSWNLRLDWLSLALALLAGAVLRSLLAMFKQAQSFHPCGMDKSISSSPMQL